MAEPEITDINELSDESVQQAEDFLTDFLQAQFPSLDLTEGRVLRNLLIRPAAIFHALNQDNFDKLRRSQSIVAIEEDPTLSDPSYVDAVLSNYRITRNPGSTASGYVTIVIQNLATTPIAENTIFTAVGLSFKTEIAYVGVTTSAAVVSESQRLIARRTDGLYAFTVPVAATAVGDEYLIRRGTRFTISPVPAGFVDASAESDFTGGTDSETNEDLVARFKLALSPQVFSGRVHIESLLKETVAAIEAVSIVGFGDAEMLRDRHNIFEIATGGKADLYVRTRSLPESQTLVKEAILANKALGVWQFTLTRDDAPGFYLVERVLPENASADQGTYEITAETRGLDLSQSENEFVPDVDNLLEGAYSRYQTAVVQFIDTDTLTDGLTENVSTQDYRVDVLLMLDVAILQDLSVDRGNRNPNADYLVRAPVPAFTAISMTVQYTSGIPEPNADAIKQAVADRVNALGFNMGKLPASIVHDAVHDVIGRDRTLVVSPIDMAASIRKPTGEYLELRDANELVIPDLPADGVTSRTTVFYLPVTAVDVALARVSVLPV